ncbi:SapC family protein [Marinobacterium weihaiense]|uniref:SapC family protein n=1 Tax=Marinobacterium weihaiense TaxID=2851016 RepID=A0ABS6M7N4_9GAMM|nr:SapC family protein [Marinobacterium weihaiense]MBV0932294.1 SapC family protein [Marinobacterium weihaiense]
MPRYIPLSANTHGAQGWHKAATLAPLANQGVLPVLLDELTQALPIFPLAFVPRQPNDPSRGFELVALMSFRPDQNLFITPDGHWLGGYRPAALRAYPFRLLKDAQADRLVLCIDADSGLITEQPDSDAQRFFDDQGQPGETLQRVLQFLQQCERSRQATQTAVDALAAQDLIEPWPVQVKSAETEAQALQGLYRINEQALNALPAATLKTLQDSHALPLAYAQLYSQPRLSGLSRLVELRDKFNAAREPLSESEVESFFEGKDDTLSFNF